ncbi:pilus assembly protein TadB, partial [Herbaspirillum sp. VT-16-41]
GWCPGRRLISRADPPVTGRVDPSVVVELIAGALESGLPLARAMEAVAESLTPGPDAEALGRAASSLRSGVPAPVAAAALPEEFEALGQSAVLAELAGADLARALRSAAQDARRGRARA